MSLRKAINEKCRDCIYDPNSGLGNWRQQVQACTCTSCPLFPYRPKSRPRGRQQSQPAGVAQGDARLSHSEGERADRQSTEAASMTSVFTPVTIGAIMAAEHEDITSFTTADDEQSAEPEAA